MLLVVTGCKDIDDALHCTALSSGNFEVGVRILWISYSQSYYKYGYESHCNLNLTYAIYFFLEHLNGVIMEFMIFC